MRPIPPPDWDPRQDYDAIVDDKHDERRARLRGLRLVVRRAYWKYRRRAEERSLHRVRPATSVDPAAAELLLHCYEVPTQSLRALKSRLRRLPGGSECPYCGLGEATTFDHYLPKSRFPELAVCADNLIPCCHRCNELRGAQDGHPGRPARVIHVFYGPSDMAVEVLVAKLDIGDLDIEVSFSVTVDDHVSFSARFLQHFEALDLANRHACAAKDEVRRLVEAYGGALELGVHLDQREWLQKQLEKTAICKAARLGANHWEAAFYRAVARSPEVLDFLARQGASS